MAIKINRKDLDNILKDGFSWTKIGEYSVPYMVRLIDGKRMKFVATRMAELEVLNKYLHNINPHLYNSCIPVMAYRITDWEAKILNKIKKKYYRNGQELQYLAGIDYIVHLEDIHSFYLFIDTCYKKLQCNKTSVYNDKCGFICIDSKPHACVPYCIQNGQKLLPLLYFEGDTENLIPRAIKLENWDLAHLRFCCKIHGLKAEFFAGDSCLVVSLDDIKNLYPPETLFEDIWPSEMAKSHLSPNWKSSHTKTPGSWFKVVPDKNTIPRTSTEPVPIIPHGTQVKKNQMVQQQQEHQQQQQIITAPQIQAQENNSNNAPYKIQMAVLEGKTIHCINAKQCIYSDWMVTLKELVWMLLPSCNVAKCAQVLLKCFKMTILFGESEQLAVLKENGLTQSMIPADTPMAMLKDITLVLPQLKTFVLMPDKELCTNTNLQVNPQSDNISAKNRPGTGEASQLSEAM